MTINMASTSTSTAYTANSTALNSLTTSSASTQSSSELTDEEKLYDADGDGTLSVEEQAAYLQAQETKKTLESSKSTKSSESASVSISEEGLKMQAQDPAKSPPDINEISDDELKNMLSDMKSKNNKLPKELNEYSDTDINSLSSDDLDNIRELMTKAQEERKEKTDLLNANNQQNPMSHAISEYKKFSTENMLSSVI